MFGARIKTAGFTLLEMLLALALLSMLMLAVTQLMSQGAEVWSNSDRDIRAVENDKIAINFLRKMLLRAKPITWRQSNEETGARSKVFVGNDDALHFAAPLPVAGSKQRGIYLFSVSAQKTEQYKNKAMVVSYRRLDEESLAKTMENEPVSEVIMTDVERLSFSYFGDKDYSDGTDKPIWQSDWDQVRDFPLAVKMSVQRSRFDADDPDAAERMAWDGLVFAILQRSLR